MKAKTSRAKSVKSLSLKSKSVQSKDVVQGIKDDDNFWPHFLPNLRLASESDKTSSGTKTATSSKRYTEKLISLPLCMQKLVSTYVSPSTVVSSGDKISAFASTFDLEELYTSALNSIIYSKTINAFDILLTNPLWQPSDFTDSRFNKWTPSNHIYVDDTVGSKHANGVSDGRYLIRLFHSNYWRAISVDDQLPVDSDKKILLPHYYDSSENKLQFWPILITKAFLKLNHPKHITNKEDMLQQNCVCYLLDDITYHNKNYLADFDPITMLTGWYGTEYDIHGQHNSQKWSTILKIFEQIKNKELVVLCINTGKNHRETVQALDIRYYPLVEPEPLQPWKLHRWREWAIQKSLYKSDKDCNGILVCVSGARASYFTEFIDNERYVGIKATVSHENQLVKTASITSNKNFQSKLKPNESLHAQKIEKYWVKFDKISKYLESIKIYHKSESYVNNLKLSSENADQDSQKYSPTVPLFLITDNPTDEVLHVTLTNMRSNEKSRKFSSLIISCFQWHTPQDDTNILVRLVAYHTATASIALPTGRHVFRLNLLADHYSALFQSNCDFKLASEQEMWAFLQMECLSMQKYGETLSSILENLVKNMATNEYKDNQQELYKFILTLFVPEWTKSKFARAFIWHEFIKHWIDEIRKMGQHESTFFIRVLFLCPNDTVSGCTYAHHKRVAQEMCAVYRELRNKKCRCSDGETTKIFEDCYVEQVQDFAASIIISWFKMLIVKRMKEYHVFDSEKFKIMKESVNAICEKFCENQKFHLYNLIRSFTSHLSPYSAMHNDLNNAIHTVKYHDIINSSGHQGTTLACSLSLTCHSLVPEKYSIQFFLTSASEDDNNDLHTIPFVKIIDEDTNCPVECMSNVYLLMRNHYGYTLYAYFWSNGDQPSQMPMSWNIEISFRKHVAPLHACIVVDAEIINGTKEKSSACDLISSNEMTRIEHEGNYKKYYDKKLCQFYGLLKADKDICLNIFFKCFLEGDIRVVLRIFNQENECLLTKETINGEIIEIGCKLRDKFKLVFSIENEAILGADVVLRWRLLVFYPSNYSDHFALEFDDTRDKADKQLRNTWKQSVSRAKLIREQLLGNETSIHSKIQNQLLSHTHSSGFDFTNILDFFRRRLAEYQ